MTDLIQVRNVPDDALRELKERAGRDGVSLNTYMLRLIEREVARPSVAEVLLRARARGDGLTTSSLAALDAARADRARRDEP
jgi:antitoxin FitA